MEPSDPEWLQLRKQHQIELDAWLKRRDFAFQNLQRRSDAEQGELLAKHAQQERDFWRRHEQRASAMPYLDASRAQSTAPHAAPPAKQDSLSSPNLKTAKTLLAKASDSQKPNVKATITASTCQRQAKQPANQRQSQQAQAAGKQALKSSTNAGQPPQAGKSKAQRTTLQDNETAKQLRNVVNLCDSDDDMLVEVSKATFKEKPTITRNLAPFRPSRPTAPLQLFSRSDKKSPTFLGPSLVKQEEHKASPSVPNQLQQYIAQPANNGIRERVAAADNASQSTVSQVATGNQAIQQYQSAPQPAFRTEASSRTVMTERLSKSLHPQIQETIIQSTNGATDSVMSCHVLLQQDQRQDSFINRGLRKGQLPQQLSALDYVLAGKDDVGVIDLEDVPLACLDISAALKQLGVKNPKNTSSNVDQYTLMAKQPLVSAHLPSPSPSLDSVPHASMSHEAAALLNLFKKPGPPLNSTGLPKATSQMAKSPAPSYTVGQSPAPTLTAAVPTQASVASRESSAQILARKRKIVNLSDNEQSEYLPMEASVAGCKKILSSHGTPLKTSTKKKTDGSGSQRSATSAVQSTPTRNPSRSVIMSQHTTPVTPTKSFSDAKDEALDTPRSKRRAAARAQTKIQDISEADAVFRTEDDIHRATIKERRRNRSSPCIAEIGTRLRSMSITPVPMGAHLGTAKNDMVFEASENKGNAFVTAGGKNSVRTNENIPKVRATKHRSAARTRNINEIIGGDSDDDEDSLEDLDISKFTYVNGIVQAGQEERLTEMQAKATTKGEL